jgi:type VI secretion system protein ImpK
MTPGGLTSAAGGARRQENLALVYQELITVGERLRTGRQQVSDSHTFRQQLLGAIEQSGEAGRKAGYPQEDVELATFAVIAFLDESILNLRSPVFSDWPKQPLQELRYGHHIAGEIFFKNLANLMGRNDSHELADLLEVYYLCLLLGFAGRYSLGGKGDLYAIVQQTGDKIQRIRKTAPELSPDWILPNDNIVRDTSDPWVKRLLWGAGGSLLLTLILFGVFKVLLNSGVSTLAELAKGGR